MDKRAANIAAAVVFCIGFLSVTGANAQALVLECSISGQEPTASFHIDATNKTIGTAKG